MASPDSSELSGDIHLAPCERESHMKWINDLKNAFEEKDIKCVAAYNHFGKISKWFEEALNNCQFTIIHKCNKLLTAIDSCQGIISKNGDKIIILEFNIRNKKKKYDTYKFLNEFTTNSIQDVKGLQDFVKLTMNSLEKLRRGNDEKKQIPSFIGQVENQGLSSPDRSEDSLIDMSPVEEGSLRKFPDMFGDTRNSHVLVRGSCFVLTDAHKYDDSKDLHEFCLSKEKWLMPDLQLFIQKLIPEKYKEEKALDLVSLAVCEEDPVGDRATIMLELLLISEHQNFSDSVFIIIESVLYEALIDMRSRKDATRTSRAKQLSFLYIITICEWISCCPKTNNINICNMHMNTTVVGRSMPKSANPALEKSFKYLDSFLAEFKSDWNCNDWRNQVDKLFNIHKDGAEPVKEREKCVWISVLFAYQCLKKTLLFKDKEHLEHFNKFFGAFIPQKSTDKSSLINHVFVHGLALLLSLGLSKTDHLESQKELCKTGMKMINKFSTKKERFDDMQPMLMFHRNKNIRSLAFKETYDEDQMQLLQGELQRLLCPLLQGQLLVTHDKEMEEFKWYQLTGTFNNKEVVIRMHKPNEKDHRERNKSTFSPHQDVYQNEFSQLQKLNHKNIIQLLALGSGIPYFYILEDFKSTNLQKALKHKQLNSNPFSPDILLKFVVDALTGLQYCHDKGFIHRNLTAESLFIVDEKLVKLCGFHLCTELHNESSKLDDKLERFIPTRWASPESLKEFVYTKASDMWMVGHLINEVFTHGKLPYEKLNFKSKDEIFRHITGGNGSIMREPVVSEAIHKHIIAPCNSYKAEDRPTVGKVLKLLQQDTNCADMEGMDLPYIDDNFKPSADHEKGVPDTLITPQFIEDQDDSLSYETVALSDVTIKLKTDQKHIFRTKLERRFTPEIMTRIDEVADILGHIRILQNRNLAHHYELSIPSTNKGNLLDLTLKRSLGDRLKPYIECLVQVGNTLEKLWARSWIIGDFCGSDVYVDKEDGVFKVYVISLSCLNLLSDNESCIVAKENLRKDAQEVFRAAPEVLEHYMFSPASDTYCFGHLIWEILTAFDNHNMKKDDFKDNLKFEGFKFCPKEVDYDQWVLKYCNEKLQEKLEERLIKPKCCSDDLYQFIKECLHVTDCNRPTKSLVDKLNEIAADL